jgi:predicted alpha/beta hydrolase family esterase
MKSPVLVMPGINNSGPSHWQSLWQAVNPDFVRIQVPDWDHPVCVDWIAAIDRAVAQAGQPVVIVAHSLGCLPVIAWAQADAWPLLKALLLVSVPDPLGPSFPREASGFAPPAHRLLPCPSILVASEDDPYGGPAHARQCAERLGSRFVNVGAAGQPGGFNLLSSLR